MGPGNMPSWTAVHKVIPTDTQCSWVLGALVRPGSGREGTQPKRRKVSVDLIVYFSVAMVPTTLGLSWAGREYASPGHRYKDSQTEG